jgi:hypothetical protein
MHKSQWGLTILGTLFVIAILALGAYFGYQWYLGGEDVPTCKNDHTACLRMCRRLSGDTTEAQKCQSNCAQVAAECERKTGSR